MVPRHTPSVMRPGTHQTSRPRSSARRALIIAPPSSGDSTTTVRPVIPTMRRLRSGKCQAAPSVPMGYSETSAPVSAICAKSSLCSIG